MRLSELHTLTLNCAIKINDVLGFNAIDIDSITDITYNARLKKSLGRAILNRFTRKYKIEFSKNYFTFSGTSLEDKTSVVYHELLHTVEGCFNHGYKFNAYASKIERATGIKDIAGRFKSTSTEFRTSNSKYKIICMGCGSEGFAHKTRLRHTNRKEGRLIGYGCRKCGSDNLEQKLNRGV